MSKFKIVDRISDPGDASKANDDWVSSSDLVAIVCDGATGLSDRRFLKGEGSDAQWVAKLAAERFVSASSDEPARELVAGICNQVRTALYEDAGDVEIPRYSWPLAGFIAARLQGELLEITGLGDCAAFAQFNDGFVQSVSALPANREHEVKAAKKDLQNRTQEGPAIEDEAVIASLRERRSRLNSPESNVWTLGPVAEAGEYVLSMAIPTSEIKSVLLVSDGFAAISQDYQRYSLGELIDQIDAHGMAKIVDEIRQIERTEDPEMVEYPRYKQSDDATAILIKIEN